MQVLNESEIDTVGGGNQVEWSVATTLGLMALAPASVLVVTTGLAALAFYGAAIFYGYGGSGGGSSGKGGFTNMIPSLD